VAPAEFKRADGEISAKVPLNAGAHRAGDGDPVQPAT
jgi:hypothetical protein